MRIARLVAYHVKVPLKMTIRHASFTRRESENVIIQCELENGMTGWGEGVPRSYVTGETIESVMDTLSRSRVREQLANDIDVESVVAMCESSTFATEQDDPRNCLSNVARCAVEMSVLDAVMKASNVSLAKVAELVPEAFGIRANNDLIHYTAPITSMSAWKQTLRGRLARWYGFRDCKAKVGVDGIDDIETLKRIRTAIGSRMTMRIDGNEAWDCEQTTAKMRQFEPFTIAAVEQPVPHRLSDGLAQVRQDINIPVMLDESLCSLTDAQHAIERGTCDLFNIRLSKCGGFISSLKIAATAHRAGLAIQLGCQVGETGILSAAGRAFAASVSGLQFVEGSYDRFLLRNNVTTRNVSWSYGGIGRPTEQAGLGVEIDHRVLERMAVRRLELKL